MNDYYYISFHFAYLFSFWCIHSQTFLFFFSLFIISTCVCLQTGETKSCDKKRTEREREREKWRTGRNGSRASVRLPESAAWLTSPLLELVIRNETPRVLSSLFLPFFFPFFFFLNVFIQTIEKQQIGLIMHTVLNPRYFYFII